MELPTGVIVILLAVPCTVTALVGDNQVTGGFRLAVCWRIKPAGLAGQVNKIVAGAVPMPDPEAVKVRLGGRVVTGRLMLGEST